MSVRTARVWTLVCIVIVAGGVGFNLWVVGSSDVDEGVAGPQYAESSPYVAVASVVGVVEVRGDGGEWKPLQPGGDLERGDEIRTGDFSQVLLRAESGSTITITPNTDFIIGEESSLVSRYTLGAGRIAADIRLARDRVYEFESVGDARADVREGRFQIAADGSGVMSVVARSGEVGLSSAGQRVVVTAGRQAVAVPGLPPEKPLPIPEDVLLQVRWPDGAAEGETVMVEGVTDVGTRLRVAGALVPVDREGRFEVELPLEEGENRFLVTVEEASGKVRTSSSPVVVRETKQRPPLEIRVEGSLWD